MKEVNGIPVYEEEDICALDEYSKQLEEALTPKFQNIEDNIIESTEKILELEKESDDQKDTTELLKLQVEELKNENTQLKNQIPTGTAEGESIYLSDSSDLEAKIIVKGNSRQRTSDGSNLYNVKDGYYTTGDPIVDSEDFITMSFDNTSGTSTKFINYFTKPNLNLKTATRYYGVLEIKNFVGSASFFVSAQQGTEAQTDAWLENKLTAENSNTKRLFEFTTINDFSNTANMFRTFLRLQAGENASITFRISVFEQKQDLETFVYQPYGVMPSPNYPSDVETVGSNVNEFDKDNTSKKTVFIDNNGYIQYNTSGYSSVYISCQKNKNYVVSAKSLRGIAFLNQEPTAGLTANNYKIQNATEITLNSGENTYLLVWYYDPTRDELTEQEILDSIKIEKGTKSTPYSPYNMGSVEIDILNKNLIDINNLIKGYVGISSSPIVWTATSNERTIIINANKYKGLTLTVSSDGNRSNLAYLDTDTPKAGDTGYLIKNNGSANTHTFTIPENPEHPYIAIQLNFGADYIPTWCQLEVGEQATEKIEHQSQAKILPIQEEMLEDDYVDDVEYHTWGKYIFTGNENILMSNTGKFYSDAIKDYAINNNIPICNYFKGHTNIGAVDNVNDGEIAFKNKEDAYPRIYIGASQFTTVEEFKVWLQEKYNSGNPVVVYYKLATPKSLPLTEQQKNILDEKTYTYKNVTNINTDSIAILDVTYKKDLETLLMK